MAFGATPQAAILISKLNNCLKLLKIHKHHLYSDYETSVKHSQVTHISHISKVKIGIGFRQKILV